MLGRKNSGITLVEMIIAMAAFTAIALGATKLISDWVRHNKNMIIQGQLSDILHMIHQSVSCDQTLAGQYAQCPVSGFIEARTHASGVFLPVYDSANLTKFGNLALRSRCVEKSTNSPISKIAGALINPIVKYSVEFEYLIVDENNNELPNPANGTLQGWQPVADAQCGHLICPPLAHESPMGGIRPDYPLQSESGFPVANYSPWLCDQGYAAARIRYKDTTGGDDGRMRLVCRKRDESWNGGACTWSASWIDGVATCPSGQYMAGVHYWISRPSGGSYDSRGRVKVRCCPTMPGLTLIQTNATCSYTSWSGNGQVYCPVNRYMPGIEYNDTGGGSSRGRVRAYCCDL